MSFCLRSAAALALSATFALRLPARAQGPANEPTILDGHLALLEKMKLSAPPAQSIDELRELLESAQRLVIAGNREQAAALLVEAVDGPRFRAFEEFDEYLTACLLVSGLLLDQHAVKSAQRAVDRVLARGPDQPTFGPAFRRAVDIALVRGDLPQSIEHLEGLARAPLPEDAANELHYLRALSAYESGSHEVAQAELDAITPRSRFYASGQYLTGAIFAQNAEYKQAEERFCRVATAGKDAPHSFYVDGRFFPVRDLSYLGLGRVAHESARSDDAFYYYFQVPNDSSRVSEALFEAAWASYEGQDHDAALDSLDQLEARYPHSPFAAEAGVLRGYIHLARCEFAEAEKHLVRFSKQFGQVLSEIDVALRSPARKRSIYRDLVARDQSIERLADSGDDGQPTPDSLLLSLVAADPDFYRLHSEVSSLNAELARTGNVTTELELLTRRVQGKDAPRARLADDTSPADAAALLDELGAAKEALGDFLSELNTLRAAGEESAELSALRKTQRALERRVQDLEARTRKTFQRIKRAAGEPDADDLVTRLQQDQSYVHDLRQTALRLRVRLESAADQAGERALRALRARLSKELRRARIGRIDAVMGSKRQVELQVESLAAGRFPPELTDPLRMQSLLRDDEEYWPFEGEDWPDEFVERYPEEE